MKRYIENEDNLSCEINGKKMKLSRQKETEYGISFEPGKWLIHLSVPSKFTLKINLNF